MHSLRLRPSLRHISTHRLIFLPSSCLAQSHDGLQRSGSHGHSKMYQSEMTKVASPTAPKLSDSRGSIVLTTLRPDFGRFARKPLVVIVCPAGTIGLNRSGDRAISMATPPPLLLLLLLLYWRDEIGSTTWYRAGTDGLCGQACVLVPFWLSHPVAMTTKPDDSSLGVFGLSTSLSLFQGPRN
ncbi:unnamed protein product [Protopolystoma xenopodis]|uniref:Uncharacterized protein n=1 Tax=Protopolystoma xenopodis TaxID=117903 RepID=A0A3S5B0J0_9PLAT|nr:unnamed protein product [Protopolystoma xenopodis]